MKKGIKLLSIAFFSIVLTSFIIPLIFAADAAVTSAEGVKSFAEGIKTFITTLMGTSTIPWANILLGIILFMIIYSIVDILFDDLWSGWGSAIISLAVSILGMMFWPAGLVETITLQYGIMGATLLTVFPLLIMLIFTIRIDSLMLARLTWVIYTIYYFFVFIYRIYIASTQASATPGSGWFALGALLIGGVMIWILEPIRRLVFKGELSADEEKAMAGVKIRKALRNVQDEEAEGYGFAKKRK